MKTGFLKCVGFALPVAFCLLALPMETVCRADVIRLSETEIVGTSHSHGLADPLGCLADTSTGLFAAIPTKNILVLPIGEPLDRRIALALRERIYHARRLAASESETQRAEGEAKLAERVSVIASYRQQVTIEDLALFVNDGRGSFRRIFRASFGFIGEIPLGKLGDVVAKMGEGLDTVVPGDIPIFSIDPPRSLPVSFVGVIPLLVLESSDAANGPWQVDASSEIDEHTRRITVGAASSSKKFYRVRGFERTRLTGLLISGGNLVLTYEPVQP